MRLRSCPQELYSRARLSVCFGCVCVLVAFPSLRSRVGLGCTAVGVVGRRVFFFFYARTSCSRVKSSLYGLWNTRSFSRVFVCVSQARIPISRGIIRLHLNFFFFFFYGHNTNTCVENMYIYIFRSSVFFGLTAVFFFFF